MALPPNPTSPNGSKAAAQHAAQQGVFLREVDDAMRQDQFESFFARYGKPLIAGVVVAIAALGGGIYWYNHQNTLAGKRGEAMVLALDSVQASNLDDAKSKLAPLAARSSSDGDASSARLLLAGIALKQGKQADAVKLYRQVADDTGAAQPLRDLANVRGVAAAFDTMKPQDVVDRLKPLAAPGNPWFGAAGELVGMAYLKQGKADQAGPLFAAIAKDEGVEDGLRSRARQLAAVLGVDAVDDVVDEKGEPLAKVSVTKVGS